MRFVLAVVSGLFGCGRINFDLREPPAIDASAVATDACALGAWSVPRRQSVTSSTSTEFGPALSSDGLTLYFESDRPGGLGSDDLWFATRATISDDFGPATHAVAISSAMDDRSPTLSSDGLTLYFVQAPAGMPGRLYRATRGTTSDPFGAPTMVSELATVTVEGPAISARGDELFFSQGLGVYHATFDGSTFQNVAAVAELNTGTQQGYPSLSGDGLDLYFETVRSDGTFDDVWAAHRVAIGDSFTTITRMDDVSVAGANDSDPEISGDGRTFVLSSSRAGSQGFDLYLATRSCL